jgi:hypothetical protein
MCVIYGCTFMTNGTDQRRPQSGAAQLCLAAVAAWRRPGRGGRADGARLCDFRAPGLPLLETGARFESAGRSQRREGRLYGQAATGPGAASSRLRTGQALVAQRVGRSSVAQIAGAEMTRWREGQLDAMRFSWNIALIVYSPSNSNRSISCWYRTSAGRSVFRRQPTANLRSE